MLELIDETLDINSTMNYDLTLQISFDRLTFTVFDTLRRKFVMLRDYEGGESRHMNYEKLYDLISADDFLVRKFRRIKVINPSPDFTLVPSPLYDPLKDEEYFLYNHKVATGFKIVSSRISVPDSYVIYSLPEPIHDLNQKFFPDASYLHHIGPLLEHATSDRRGSHGYYLHMHLENEYFNLIVMGFNTLKFCNSFSYKTTSDIIYFCAGVMRTLGLGSEETLHLSGITDRVPDLTEALSDYIRHVKNASSIKSNFFSYIFSESQIFRYFTLFSQAS